MNFEFNGNKYRIVFRHDPNRLLSAHIGHACEVRKDKAKNRTITVCLKCRIVIGTDGAIGATLPKSMRVRKTWCVIQYYDFTRAQAAGEVISGVGITKGLYDWKDFVGGCGTPNVEMGDVFNRADGREASLKNTLETTAIPDHITLAGTTFPLGQKLSEDFKQAVKDCYALRKMAVKA